jgi:hypothetical protein
MYNCFAIILPWFPFYRSFTLKAAAFVPYLASLLHFANLKALRYPLCILILYLMHWRMLCHALWLHTGL